MSGLSKEGRREQALGSVMNRMVFDYEKRGMTTAHLRQTVADREAKPSEGKPVDEPSSAPIKPKS